MQVRTSRKILNGRVISNKNSKTIVVSVESYKKHPLYSKRFKTNKKYQAHDEKNEANIGDMVMLSETKPYSKTKTFRLVKIIEHAKKGGDQ